MRWLVTRVRSKPVCARGTLVATFHQCHPTPNFGVLIMCKGALPLGFRVLQTYKKGFADLQHP